VTVPAPPTVVIAVRPVNVVDVPPGMSVTLVPFTSLNVVFPAETNLTLPPVLTIVFTRVGSVLTSSTFTEPAPAEGVKVWVLIFSAVVGVPKEPEVVLS